MAQQYKKEHLRAIFQSPFDQEAWKAILHNLFRAELIRKETDIIEADNADARRDNAHHNPILPPQPNTLIVGRLSDVCMVTVGRL